MKMLHQLIVPRGTELKRLGVGLISAGLLTAATACSLPLLPAPVAAPAPAAAPAGGTSTQTERAHALEMFRSTSQPAVTESHTVARPLEFYRYEQIPGVVVASPGAAHGREMFRYTPAFIGMTESPATRQPREFFRYTGQPSTRPALSR
jgi:hypothetical protein